MAKWDAMDLEGDYHSKAERTVEDRYPPPYPLSGGFLTSMIKMLRSGKLHHQIWETGAQP